MLVPRREGAGNNSLARELNQGYQRGGERVRILPHAHSSFLFRSLSKCDIESSMSVKIEMNFYKNSAKYGAIGSLSTGGSERQ